MEKNVKKNLKKHGTTPVPGPRIFFNDTGVPKYTLGSGTWVAPGFFLMFLHFPFSINIRLEILRKN